MNDLELLVDELSNLDVEFEVISEKTSYSSDMDPTFKKYLVVILVDDTDEDLDELEALVDDVPSMWVLDDVARVNDKRRVEIYREGTL